jgi:protein-disulfide isomerase
MKLRNILIAAAAGLALAGTAFATPALLAAPAAAADDGGGTDGVPAAVTDLGDHEHVLGDPDAPLTIIEYSSLTCPHCADFHSETLPKLKENWIAPGKAKLVFRHYPLDRLALAGAMLTDCFEGKRFFAVLDMLFAKQEQWVRSDNPGRQLQKLAGQAGMDSGTFEQCISDQDAAKRILDKRDLGRNKAGIEATPTFLVEGRKIQGARSYETFADALKAAEDGA